MMTGTRRIPSYLVVDDDRRFCARLVLALERHGHDDVAGATSLEEARALVERRAWDRAVVDMCLDDGPSGFELVREIRRRHPATRVVMMTNYPSLEAFRVAAGMGAIDLVLKTDDVPELQHAFARPDRTWHDTSRLPIVPPTLEEVEWEHINRVLTLVGGHASLGAKLLGINRTTLYRKLEKMPPAKCSRAMQLALAKRVKEPVAELDRASAERARADEAGDDAFDNWTQDDRKLDTTVRKVNRNPLGDGHLGCGMCCGMSEPLSRTSRTARGCGSMERRRWRQPRISGAPINAGALRRAPSGRHPCPSGVRTA